MANLFTPEQEARYREDGFIVLRGLLSPEEVELLVHFARNDQQLAQSAYGRRDATGQPVRLALWNEPDTPPYGLLSRLPRIADRAEQLLEEEVYHWHTKLILKEPRVGGAWEWHQDYGYWYEFGCLYPRLLTVWIALDPSTGENGCLQVLRGSHKLGRIDHGTTGDQTGADLERVQEAMKRHEHVYVEAEPGDAVFFHCNLLHRSDQNRSEKPRWSIICCYNVRSNSPYKQPSRHPAYRPLPRVAENALLAWAKEQTAG